MNTRPQRYIAGTELIRCMPRHGVAVPVGQTKRPGWSMHPRWIDMTSFIDRRRGAMRLSLTHPKRVGVSVRIREDGFTLLELLVVIAILGLLIGLVAPAALRQLGSAKVSIARQSIERITSILDLYKLDVGDYPTTDQGLQALVVKPVDASAWNGPYLKGEAVPIDPWSRPYVYRSPSNRGNHEYDLCSRGPSGKGGESGEEDMICNP